MPKIQVGSWQLAIGMANLLQTANCQLQTEIKACQKACKAALLFSKKLWVPDHFVHSSNSRPVLWLLYGNDIEKFLHLPRKALLNAGIAVHEFFFHINAVHLVLGHAGF